MLKSSVTMEYGLDRRPSMTANLTLNATDFKLEALVSEATFETSPSLSNLVLSLDKPASMSIVYNIPMQDLRFNFTNKGNILNKELHTTYMHWRKENRMAIDGTISIDSRHKVCANYEIGDNAKSCKLKYSYFQGNGARIFEPCYDLTSNSWEFSLLQRVYDGNLVKASFQSFTQVLGLEWSRTSSCNNGFFKVLASLNTGEKLKIPKISAESTWDFDM